MVRKRQRQRERERPSGSAAVLATNRLQHASVGWCLIAALWGNVHVCIKLLENKDNINKIFLKRIWAVFAHQVHQFSDIPRSDKHRSRCSICENKWQLTVFLGVLSVLTCCCAIVKVFLYSCKGVLGGCQEICSTVVRVFKAFVTSCGCYGVFSSC